MASRSDEIETSVDTQVDFVHPSWLLLLEHVRFVLIIQEFDNGHPRVAVVHVVPKARSVNDCQTD